MDFIARKGHITAVLNTDDRSLRITNDWDRLQCNGITQVVLDGTQVFDLATAMADLARQVRNGGPEAQSVREYVDERQLGGTDHDEDWFGRISIAAEGDPGEANEPPLCPCCKRGYMLPLNGGVCCPTCAYEEGA